MTIPEVKEDGFQKEEVMSSWLGEMYERANNKQTINQQTRAWYNRKDCLSARHSENPRSLPNGAPREPGYTPGRAILH
jgi:hypothetical protein